MVQKKYPSIDDNPIQIALIEEFQCPGCVCGCDVSSGCFKPESDSEDDKNLACKAHVAGTIVSHIGTINLGLPRGFNRLGFQDQRVSGNTIRLWDSVANMPEYNHFNVAVWGLEMDGHLFVRCYCPRINQTYVDVIKGGTMADLPEGTVDVSGFYAGMD